MAFPFKTGGDFYNCEAQRMRLHNLGANPTETATGLMYFNTGTSNLGKHAVVHDGTNFKALAFVDEIATNTAFTELANRVLTIEKALGEDTANVIDTWEEIQNFLKDIDDNDANLMTMLNGKADKTQLEGYLPLSGGTISGSSAALLKIDSSNASYNTIIFNSSGVSKSEFGYALGGYTYIFDYSSSKYLGIDSSGIPFFGANEGTNKYALIHSGNYNSYAPKLDGTGASGTWGINISGNAASSTIARYIETLDVSGNRWYGDSYRLYGQWISEDTLELKVDGYKTRAWQAKELAFARTIWGQSFDGTGNISGELSGVTNINSALYINSSGNVTIGNSDLAGTSNTKLWIGGEARFTTDVYFSNWAFIKTYLIDGTAHNVIGVNNKDILYINDGITVPTIIRGGNVGIGTLSPEYKLDVAGTGRFTGAVTMASTLTVGENTTLGANLYIGNDKVIYMANKAGTNVHAMFIDANDDMYIGYSNINKVVFRMPVTMGSTLTVGGNITPNAHDAYTLGTSSNQWSHLYAVGATLSGALGVSGATTLGSTLSVSGAATLSSAVTIKGDLVVEGNIIGKKEVSAGGAGQEGESGAGGGAEVISQTLASGASSYTITNTIKRSDIAVSLYEWNASGNSWDMCLADISVTDSNITVTFGSATNVNHKLVAVG